MKKHLPILWVIIVSLLALPGSTLAQNTSLSSTFTYQGYLTNASGSVSGTCDFQFGLFNAATAGAQIGSTLTQTGVTVTNGTFSVQLDFGGTALDGTDRYLEIAVRCPTGSGSYTTLSPRQAVTPTPYTLFAEKTPWNGLSGIPAGFADAVDNDMLAVLSCSNGQIAKWNGTSWVCAADNDTTYTSGTGLSLTSGQFALTTSYQLPQACANNQIPKWNGTSWTCAADANNAYAAGTGLSLVGGQFSLTIPYQLPQSCTNGQIASWNGTSWTCAADANNVYTSGTGLILASGQFSISTSYQLPQTCTNNQIPKWNGTSWTCAADSGGTDWTQMGNSGTTPGTNFIGTTDLQPLEFRVNNQRVLRLEPNAISPNIIGGFSGNFVTGGVVGATIGGGGDDVFINQVNADFSTVSGGEGNTASEDIATVAGGVHNTAGASISSIGGGSDNTTTGEWATVSGGDGNTASNIGATVGGGIGNIAGGTDLTIAVTTATVGGGSGNKASGNYSTVPGGVSNTAAGQYSFAAGRRADAAQDGTFVWADSTDADFSTNLPNQFFVRASGGIAFYTSANLSSGAQLSSGSGSWSSLSDRNAKSNFVAIDPQAILQSVVSLPISTWNYNAEDPAIRHIGPMAQDFYASFGVGEDNTHISTIDSEGVALAAIQGLYQQVQAKDAELASNTAQIASLQSQLDDVKTQLSTLQSGQPLEANGLPSWVVIGMALIGMLQVSVIILFFVRRPKAQ